MSALLHTIVYREPGRYAGWPANYGIWNWGQEIVVAFAVGYLKRREGFHACDEHRPLGLAQCRSTDGGHSWRLEEMPYRAPGILGLSTDEHSDPEMQSRNRAAVDAFEPLRPVRIDFLHPDFALMCGRYGLGVGARSWFYVTYDRCRSWRGPFELPMFGLPGVAARTDYSISNNSACTLFLTSAKSDGHEGRPFCARTVDGGLTFQFRSWIGPEPAGFAIMPATVRLSPTRVLTAIRRRESDLASSSQRNWIDIYGSDDDCGTWKLLSRAASNTGCGGSPPTLTGLTDRRLCVTYGYRDHPAGIRGRISADGGASWGDETILRADGGSHDLGYPRTVLCPDGKLVTVYYFNDHADGERYIAATIWDP